MQETSKGFHLREDNDYYDLNNIENFNTQKANDLIEEIESKMMAGTQTPSQGDNQLANRDFVNSSIAHMSANPRGNWATWSDVPSDPQYYPEDANHNKKPTNNDYMVVQDMTGYINPDEPTRTYEGTWRFTYVGEWDDAIPGGTRGKLGWKPIYQVNEKPLTQAQVDSLNSGSNSIKVTNYDNHINSTQNPHHVTKAQVGLGDVNNTSDANKPVSTLQQAELDKKVNINQGTSYNGKVLGIVEGNVTPVDPPQEGATPEQLATKLDKTNEIKKLAVVTEMPEARDLYTLYFVVEDEEEWPGLKFTSTGNSTVGYIINGTVNKDIYTSSDGKTWTSWDGTAITLNQGESIYVWNKLNTLSTSYSNYLQFTMTGSIAASGNCDSMINFSELSKSCYAHMFQGCAVLTTAPYLPAINLTDGCYVNMFYDCTSLITAPNLPATVLAGVCYASMFKNCSNLITAPELPATTLVQGCYEGMFVNCTNLSIAPELPATTLDNNCYFYMFSGCSILNSIKLSYTGNFLQIYCDHWVKGVSSSGTLYYNGSDTSRGDSSIPQNWAVQSFTP